MPPYPLSLLTIRKGNWTHAGSIPAGGTCIVVNLCYADRMKVKPLHVIIAVVVAVLIFSRNSDTSSTPTPTVTVTQKAQAPSTTTTSGNAEDDFIGYVNSVNPSMVTIYGRDSLIETAYSTCEFFRSGHSLQEYGVIAQETIGTDYGATLAAAAILAFCPDQKYKVQQ